MWKRIPEQNNDNINRKKQVKCLKQKTNKKVLNIRMISLINRGKRVTYKWKIK